MMLLELLADTWRNARARWLRILLTGSGIAWGLALFICLAGMSLGSRLHFTEKMEAVGAKVIYVFPGSVARAGGGERSTRHLKLDSKDPPRLPASPRIERSAGEVWSGLRLLEAHGRTKVVYTYGVESETQIIRRFRIGQGRFVSRRDVEQRARVLVLGHRVAERLFGRRPALGAQVRLDGHPFRVVGVSQRKGQQMVNMGPMDDEQVLLPLSTAQTLFTGGEALSYVLYDPRSRDEDSDSMQRVLALLGRHHHFGPRDDQAVEFFNASEMIRLIEAMGWGLQIFLTACGLMTLAAGGVGVMNIMLVAVAERTRELALRRALGARRRDVFVQLLAETVLVTVASGVAGVLAGVGVVRLLQAMRDAAGDQLLLSRPVLTPGIIGGAFAVLVATGIAAGIAPARRAARLEPADGLRDE